MRYCNVTVIFFLLAFVFGGCSSLGNGSLIDRLISSDTTTAHAAAAHFVGMDESARSKMRLKLFSALDDSRVDMRRRAVTAMGTLAPFDDNVLPALTKALTDSDSRVRLDAIDGFAKVKTVPPQAVRLLINTLKGGGRYSPSAAAGVLAKIDDPEVKRALRAFRLEEDIRFFGWRSGDKATFKVGRKDRYGSQVLLEEGVYLVRQTENVKRGKDRITATVLQTMWKNYGEGVPVVRARFTYVADTSGVYADLEMLEPSREKFRIYIAKFPLTENSADSKFGTILRKFGRPDQFASIVPDSDCILINLNVGTGIQFYTGLYHTYCKGVGLVSFSDDKPDLDAGVPGGASTYVFILDNFEKGKDETVESNVSDFKPLPLPESLRGKVLTNISASKLMDSPLQYKKQLLQVRGRVIKIISPEGKYRRMRFGIYEAGKTYGGGLYVPLLSEEYSVVQNIAMLRDSEGGKYAVIYKDGRPLGMKVPLDGTMINIVGRYLGNAYGSTEPSPTGPYTVEIYSVGTGLCLEATDVLETPSSQTRTQHEQAPSPSSPKSKDATQMGLDELNQYLKRGSSDRQEVPITGRQTALDKDTNPSSDLTGKKDEAIAFAKSFPINFSLRGLVLPAIAISGNMAITRNLPETIQQYQMMINLITVKTDLDFLHQGKIRQIEFWRRHHLRWAASASGGPIYQVTCFSPVNARSKPDMETRFEVNLSNKTIKPLTFGAWCVLDVKGAFAWGKTHDDSTYSDSDVSVVAPTFHLDESSLRQSKVDSPGDLPESHKIIGGLTGPENAQSSAPETACTAAERQSAEGIILQQAERSKRSASISLRIDSTLNKRVKPINEPPSVHYELERESREALHECEQEERSLRELISGYVKKCGQSAWSDFWKSHAFSTVGCSGRR